MPFISQPCFLLWWVRKSPCQPPSDWGCVPKWKTAGWRLPPSTRMQKIKHIFIWVKSSRLYPRPFGDPLEFSCQSQGRGLQTRALRVPALSQGVWLILLFLHNCSETPESMWRKEWEVGEKVFSSFSPQNYIPYDILPLVSINFVYP